MGTVSKRKGSNYYQYQYRHRGKLVRGSTKTTNKRDAMNIMRLKEADSLKAIPVHTYERTTFEHLKEIVIKDGQEKGIKSLHKVKAYLNTLEQFFDIPMMDVNAKLIARYKVERVKTGLMKSSINRELAELRKGLNLLDELDMILKAPKVKLFPEGEARQMFVTVQEYNRFINSLRTIALWFVPVCELGIRTGWRRSSLLNLCWKHVDRENTVIRCPGQLTKTGLPVVYYYANDTVIKDMIDNLWQEKPDCESLFTKNGKRINYYYTHWNRAVLDSGIADGGYNSKAKRTFKFHDLRRSALVWNEEAVIPRTVSMEQAGIKSSSIYDRYNIVDKARLESAVNKRQEYMNQIDEEAKSFRKGE